MFGPRGAEAEAGAGAGAGAGNCVKGRRAELQHQGKPTIAASRVRELRSWKTDATSRVWAGWWGNSAGASDGGAERT